MGSSSAAVRRASAGGEASRTGSLMGASAPRLNNLPRLGGNRQHHTGRCLFRVRVSQGASSLRIGRWPHPRRERASTPTLAAAMRSRTMKSSAIKRHWLLASAGTVVGIAAWTAAGPINPPAGPVASSYKTLTEVEPRVVVNATNTPGDANSVYRITASGSYYLDQNLTCVSGKHGIKIDAENVTLD